MLNSIQNSERNDALLERWRVAAVGEVAGVCLVGAVAVGAYNAVAGCYRIATVLGIAGLALFPVLWFLPEEPARRLRWGNAALAIALASIAAVAIIEVPSDSDALYYIALILFAGHFFTAPRFTGMWMVGCWSTAGGLLLIELAIYGQLKAPSRLLDAVLYLGVCTLLARLSHLVEAAILGEVRGGEAAMAEQIRTTEQTRRRVEQAARELSVVNQELEAATHVKSQFLANMSHEIRTPMTAVLGITSLLEQDGGLSPDQQHLVEVARRAGDSLLSLLNDLLDVSKIHAGRMELRPSWVSTRTLAEDVVTLFSAKASKAGVELSFELDPGLAPAVEVDAVRVSQVLRNLVSNALKFTERGSVRLRLSKPRDGWLRVEVQDTGVGIEEAHMKRVFTAFSQVDESNTRAAGGTGLGLTICKELTELMGGSIGVRAREGGGSCFWCEWPVRFRQEAAVAPARANGAPAGADLGHLRVLVAEDNRVNQLVLTRFLGILGVEPELVEDGQAAVAAVAERGPYDVVLMDCHMPRMDGFDAALEVRRRGLPAGRIIAVSASATTQDIERSHECGMDDYLSKPYTIEELANVLLNETENLTGKDPKGLRSPPKGAEKDGADVSSPAVLSTPPSFAPPGAAAVID